MIQTQTAFALPGGPVPGAPIRATASAGFLGAPGSPMSLPAGVRSAEEFISRIRAASPLPVDAQRLVDDEVQGVYRDELVLVADLMEDIRLVKPVPNWLSVPLIYRRRLGGGGKAHVGMVPDSRADRFVLDQGGDTRPIPAYWSLFDFGLREVETANRVGYDIEDGHAAEATRAVNELIEDQAWNGLSFNVGGFSAPGVLNAPGTNALALAKAWDDPTITGAEILSDVLDMLALSRSTRKRRGPHNLYVPLSWGDALDKEFKDVNGPVGSIRKRLGDITSGENNRERPLRIRATAKLTNKTALIPMQREEIRFLFGQEPTPLSWTIPPGFHINHMVLAAGLVDVRTDYSTQTGIVIGSAP